MNELLSLLLFHVYLPPFNKYLSYKWHNHKIKQHFALLYVIHDTANIVDIVNNLV